MPEIFFKVGIIAMAALVTINFVCTVRMYSYLRLKHHAAWVRLGEPSLILNNSIRNNQRCLWFLLRRDYLSIGDPSLTTICDTTRLVMIVAFALFGVIVVTGTVFGVAN